MSRRVSGCVRAAARTMSRLAKETCEQRPVHLGVPGPPAGGEVRAGPPRAPDCRRADPRRARSRRGTLAGVFAVCSALLAPLTELITERNAAAAHLHADETSWHVFAAVQGKDSHRWWCWVFVGPDTTVFRIAPSRSTKVLAQQVGIDTDTDTDTLTLPDALPAGRQVLLSSDFYAVYQLLGRVDGIDNLWCWSHYPDLRVMRTSV